MSKDFDRKSLESIVKLFQSRINTLLDFIDWTDFLFTEEIKIDEETRKKYFPADTLGRFKLLGERLKPLQTFDAKSAEEVFRSLVAELKIQASELVHPVRVALTGRTIGPGLFETMAVLGKEKTIKRLAEAAKTV